VRGTETKLPKTTTFLVLLNAAAIIGMLTLALRSTPALGPAPVLHLGSLAGL
jgi:hypothetical protein